MKLHQSFATSSVNWKHPVEIATVNEVSALKGRGEGPPLAGDETKKQRKRDTVEEVIFRKVYRRFIFKRRKRRRLGEQMEISIGI